MSRTAKPTDLQRPMSCVSIDHRTYLLPFADGQKLIEIMQRALSVDERYAGGLRMVYQLRADCMPHISMAVVMPEQVRGAVPESTVDQVRRRAHLLPAPGEPT